MGVVVKTVSTRLYAVMRTFPRSLKAGCMRGSTNNHAPLTASKRSILPHPRCVCTVVCTLNASLPSKIARTPYVGDGAKRKRLCLYFFCVSGRYFENSTKYLCFSLSVCWSSMCRGYTHDRGSSWIIGRGIMDMFSKKCCLL